MASPSLDEETAKKVHRQVEFYFSDSNLPRDNFLKKSIGESEDGLVSLALICSFTRMRSHLGLETLKPEEIPEETVKAVADVLRKSEFLKLSEDGKRVGRITELKAEEVIEQVDTRTIAASPLEYNVKLENVESFFTQFAKVNSVRLPRHVADKRVFCGTALVEFSAQEDAERVLNESVVYAGVELELKPKKDFDAERAKMMEEFENAPPMSSDNKNNSDPQLNYPKGLLVAFTLKRIGDGGSTEENGTREPAASENTEGLNVDGSKDSSEKINTEADQAASEHVNDDAGLQKDTTEGANNGLESSEKEHESGEQSAEGASHKDGEKERSSTTYKKDMNVVMREDLKNVFGKFGTVKFVDFKMGDESGHIRFEEPEAAQKARAAAVLAEEGGLLVKNYVATLEPVTGEAEKEYWGLLRGGQDRFRDTRGGRGRGGKHFRGGKHPRSRGNDSGFGRANKSQKVGR
ncbi:la protein 1 [Syzygium oleosum]|uniref:la protein 1 n=1 Tax=Syzygium oleosum TaxID=219896 RepID=UPI0011D2C47D|nr:la protein 1 [Syzygium oleosum]